MNPIKKYHVVQFQDKKKCFKSSKFIKFEIDINFKEQFRMNFQN